MLGKKASCGIMFVVWVSVWTQEIWVSAYKVVNTGYPREVGIVDGGRGLWRGINFFFICLDYFTYNGHTLSHLHNLKFTIKKKGKLSAHLTIRKKDNCLIFRSFDKQDPTLWIIICVGQYKKVFAGRQRSTSDTFCSLFTISFTF